MCLRSWPVVAHLALVTRSPSELTNQSLASSTTEPASLLLRSASFAPDHDFEETERRMYPTSECLPLSLALATRSRETGATNLHRREPVPAVYECVFVFVCVFECVPIGRMMNERRLKVSRRPLHLSLSVTKGLPKGSSPEAG